MYYLCSVFVFAYAKSRVSHDAAQFMLYKKHGVLAIIFISCVTTKRVIGGSEQVQHKLGCTVTEDCLTVEISDLLSGWIVLHVSKFFSSYAWHITEIPISVTCQALLENNKETQLL